MPYLNKINKVKVIVSILLILVMTFLAFYPSLRNDFVNWDDSKHVTDNPFIKHLSWGNVKRIFSSLFLSNYLPLTILTYAFDCSFSKLNPFGYHLTNLILHLLNSLLVFWLFYILTKNVPVTLITAILFGIHPLHVESVAWVSERKDVLYAFFFLGAMIFYVYYLREKRTSKYYYLSLIFFICSLLSKAMAITLPVVLLFIDYFLYRKHNKTIIIDKIPFFVLSFIFGIIAVLGQYSSGAVRNEGTFNLFNKFAVASYSIIFYLSKILVPVKLSCLYPYPDIKHILFYLYPSIIAIILLTVIIISGRYTRKIVFASSLFLVTLIPVLQFIPFGRTIVADRYVYISCIGVFYAIAVGFFWLYTRRAKYAWLIRFSLIALLLVIICTLAFLTRGRCPAWKDSITLWDDVLNNYTNVSLAYYHRGVISIHQGNLSQAISDLSKVIEINPSYSVAYYNRGVIYMKQGNLDQAISDFNKAIEINPGDVEAYNNRAGVSIHQGNLSQAISDLSKVIEINPSYSVAYYNRGVIYMQQGNLSQAISDFNKAIEINPNDAQAYNNRGIIYFLKNEYDKSWEDVHKIEQLRGEVRPEFLADLKRASGRER